MFAQLLRRRLTLLTQMYRALNSPEGTRRSADVPERNQFVPNSMLVRPAGSASQPTGRLAICDLVQRSSGIVTSTS